MAAGDTLLTDTPCARPVVGHRRHPACGPWSSPGGVGLAPSGDDILGVGDLPHDWLFPRMAAVVQHAGAGTTGAGLRASIPAVPVPVLVDQPFWAARVHRLGVAPHPLPLHELTSDALADALRSCLDEPAYRHRAAGLARRVRADDGSAAVLALIARLARRPPAAPRGVADATGRPGGAP